MTTRLFLLGPALITTAFTGAALWSAPAQAGLAACGDIHVEANAECEVLVEGGCVAQCEPVRFEAACAAQLQVNCDGECSAEASVNCAADCAVDCVGECEVDPGAFDCRGACNADCQGECSASCDSSDSECRAACDATCSAGCEGRCEATPPSAACDVRCNAACEGSCEAEANLQCQVDCQADGFATCEADLQGGCEAQCTKPEGALFCDGQYIDHGGNLDECVAALRAQLNIEVEGYADGQCANGRCEGEAGGSLSCAVAPAQQRPWWVAFGVFGVVGLVGLRRR